MKNLLFLLLLCSNIVNGQIKQIDSTQHITVTPSSILVPTGTNTANLDFTGYAPLSVTKGISDNLAPLLIDVPIIKSQIAAIGAPPPPISILTSTYTLTLANNNQDVYCPKNCTIFFVSGLPNTFRCNVWNDGGIVTFSGKTNSKNGWKRLTTINSCARVSARGGDVFNLSGDLKL